jgi:hypothetical protein
MVTGAVQVVCPECGRRFLVPDGAPETLCPGCDEHIVWRQCLPTGQVFPVLARWTTWEHPGCSAVHSVDLTASAGDTADDKDAPIVVAERAMWLDEDVRGRLLLDRAGVTIAPEHGDPLVVAALADVTDIEITPSDQLAVPAGGPARHAARGARIVLTRADGSSATLDALVGAAELEAALAAQRPRG